MYEHWQLILATIGTLLTLAGIVYGIGRLRGTLVTKKELYKEDGSRIYQAINDCKDERDGCQTVLCNKIDTMKSDLDEYKKEMRDEMKNVSYFMGEMTGILKAGGIVIKGVK